MAAHPATARVVESATERWRRRESNPRKVSIAGVSKHLAHLLDEPTERPSVLSRDRVEPTGIAIALVGREGQLAPSHRKPARRVLVDVDDEPDGPSIASGCSCRIGIPELRLEASAE